jgi:hypothetical protein
MPATSLFAALDQVPDFRHPGGKRHPLRAVLALSVCAMLSGCRSLYAIAQFGRDHAAERAEPLGFRRQRTPSVATLHRVFKCLNVARFEAVLRDWLAACVADRPPPAGAREALAVDGKTLRGSQGHQLPGVHLVAAFSHRLGIPLAQVPVDSKTNEAKAVLPLLRGLVLEGKVVTGDALFCQREICEQVVGQGGHYVFTVKDNPPTLLQEIQTLLPSAPPSRSSRRARSTSTATAASGGTCKRAGR